jgi:hypothetical protein
LLKNGKPKISDMIEFYKPLPESVTVTQSDIEGLGLFATQYIVEGSIVGVTHVKDDRFEDGYIRTPLGGFYNYAKYSNCENIIEGDLLLLRTKYNIDEGEELTVTYLLYDPTK